MLIECENLFAVETHPDLSHVITGHVLRFRSAGHWLEASVWVEEDEATFIAEPSDETKC